MCMGTQYNNLNITMSYIEGPHPLLESSTPPYTNATVRRAFIVWMHCGQRNSFKDVCNYYHHLETLEDKFPADRRASSRHHEFNMYSTPPPTSPYLEQMFPKLYCLNNIEHHMKQADHVKNDTSNLKLDVLAELGSQNNVTAQDIVNTSDMITTYCKTRIIPLQKFLCEFKEFAKKCELNYTVNNVASYIKRKMVEEELLMVENYSKSLHLLNLSDDKAESTFDLKKLPTFEDATTDSKMYEKDSFWNNNNAKQIKILTRHKQDAMDRYWNKLTCKYGDLTNTNNMTTI